MNDMTQEIGPWKMEDGTIIDSNGHCVRYDSPWHERAWEDDEEALKNMKLMAAAPELLDACREALRMYEEIQPAGGWQGVEDSLISAINKAEGKG